MGNNWRHPGWQGAVLYAMGAGLAGGLVTIVGRLSIARQRGRRRVAVALPDGGIIVISNHTSYADLRGELAPATTGVAPAAD